MGYHLYIVYVVARFQLAFDQHFQPRYGGVGFADLSSERPMTSSTRVQVGSVAKVLVAPRVLRLVSPGELDLHTNVEQLLPELRWQNPWSADSPIAGRHLLEQTARLDGTYVPICSSDAFLAGS